MPTPAFYSRPLAVVMAMAAWLLASVSYGQGIEGLVTDAGNEALPFTTVSVENTTQGTSANAEGRYRLSLAPGTYRLVFQHVGFRQQVRTVRVDTTFQTLDVTLPAENFLLQTVVIDANAEDPAYPIMRAAIAHRRFYREEVETYENRVYIKGVGRLLDYPDYAIVRQELRKNGIDTGIVFLTESVSRVRYTQPDRYQEEVIALKTSGSDELTFINRTTRVSFYDPVVLRAVSPLASTAFNHYDFQLDGSFEAQGFLIHKIKVTPLRNKAPLFRGYIYIVDKRYNLHSVNLRLQVARADVHVRQVFAPADGEAWLLRTHQVDLKGYEKLLDIFRVDFSFQYLVSQSEYRVQLNPDRERLRPDPAQLPSPDSTEKAQLARADTARVPTQRDTTRPSRQQVLAKAAELKRQAAEAKDEADAPPPPRDENDLTLRLDSNATGKDENFWQQLRPVPLTREEQRDYLRRDTLVAVRRSSAYLDSVERVQNEFRALQVLFGYQYRNTRRGITFRYPPLIQGIQFNTVEGWLVESPMTLEKVFRNEQVLELTPAVRFGFASERLYARLGAKYHYQPQRRSYFSLAGGRYATQFNDRDPISGAANTFTTLLLERNLIRLYEQEFLRAEHQTEVANGWLLRTSLLWSARTPLRNQTDETWLTFPDRDYAENVPRNEEAPAAFAPYRALVATAELEWQPNQRYVLRKGRKEVVSRFEPVLGLGYRKGIPAFTATRADFDQLTASVRQRLRPGYRGTLAYAAQGGWFWRAPALHLIDFQHFDGNRTPFLPTDDRLTQFHLLDYYRFSTGQRHLQAHVEYTFARLLIPRLFPASNWREVGTVHYLTTPTAGQYAEVALGINGILQLLRLDVAASFREGRYQTWGVRLGLANGIRF